jgi:FPC/CPF motif-containing protein YcgG
MSLHNDRDDTDSTDSTDNNMHTDVAALQQLANTITKTGLRDPLALLLNIIKPIDFITSQVALFVSPFTHGGRWEHYTTALTEETNWQTLRLLLEKEDN